MEVGGRAVAADFTAEGRTPEHKRMVGGQMNKMRSSDAVVTL
jgi:hypothetical protein